MEISLGMSLFGERFYGSSSNDSFIGLVPGGGIEFLIPIGKADPILKDVGEMSSKHVTQLIIGTLFRYRNYGDKFYTITVYTGLHW